MIENFYTKLSPQTHLEAFLQAPSLMRPVPDDWSIVVIDVANSTQAVAEGRSRDVNVIGAALIAAFINHAEIFALPHTFGGDGATVLIPPELVEIAIETLTKIRQLAKLEFDLDSYGGVVSLQEVRAAGSDVLIGKLQPCSHYSQAIFCGGGLQYAEQLVKSSTTDAAFELERKHDLSGAFAGLVCPWQPIRNERGLIVNLIVDPSEGSHEDNFAVCYALLQKIESMQGAPNLLNPVNPANLSFTRDRSSFSASVTLKTAGRGKLIRWLQMRLSLVLVRCFECLTTYGVELGRFDFAQAKAYITPDVDYLRYDDLLRLTTVLTPAQIAELRAYLERARERGELNYGMSSSPAAVLTCFVQRDGRHLGLLDGADGGFTRAAGEYKRQL